MLPSCPDANDTKQQEEAEKWEVQAADDQHLAKRHIARRDEQRDESAPALQPPRQHGHADKEDESQRRYTTDILSRFLHGLRSPNRGGRQDLAKPPHLEFPVKTNE